MRTVISEGKSHTDNGYRHSRGPEVGTLSVDWNKNKEAGVARTMRARWKVVGDEVREVKWGLTDLMRSYCFTVWLMEEAFAGPPAKW